MRLIVRVCAATVTCAAAVAVGGCADEPGAASASENGRLLLRQFGCASCHRIPGVAGAVGNVGPPLDGIARRVYLAGRLPNSPENLVRWIRDPRGVDPDTAMPDLGVTEAQARDIVAHLQELK